MNSIINRVSTIFREGKSTEIIVREFETQCADKCQNLSKQEFKHWLSVEVERSLIRKFVIRKLHITIISNELTIYEVYDCIDKITEYIYRTYKSSYFTPVETISTIHASEHEEEEIYENEMENV